MDILLGVPQEFQLDPLLFSIFWRDLLLFLHDIPAANYVVYKTLFCFGFKTPKNVLSKLKNPA